jgi:hypothetical protein
MGKKTDNSYPENSSEAAAPPLEAVDREDVVESTNVTYAHHVPGAALETKQDREAMKSYLAEERTEDYLYVAPLVTETHSPEANLRSRDNIVPDGPGTVETYLERD